MIWERRQDKRTSLCDLVAVAQKAPKFEYDFNHSAQSPAGSDVSKETLSASYRGNNVVVCWKWFGDLKKGGGFLDRFLNCVYGARIGKTNSEIYLNCGADVNGFTIGIGSDDESERRRIREIAEIAKTKYLSQRRISKTNKLKEKFKKRYDEIKDIAHKGRFYANFYGGPILTSGGTVAALRYMMFPAKYTDPVSETVAWGAAAVTSLPYQIFSVPAGFGLGMISAMQLAKSRAKKKKVLEENVEAP